MTDYHLDKPESELCPKDRLCLAWARMNGWEWDPLFGDKPEGFDDMETAHILLQPYMQAMNNTLTPAEQSRFWWVYGLGRTVEAWELWWYRDRVLYEVEAYKEHALLEQAGNKADNFGKVFHKKRDRATNDQQGDLKQTIRALASLIGGIFLGVLLQYLLSLF